MDNRDILEMLDDERIVCLASDDRETAYILDKAHHEIKSMRQELASQPPVDVLVEALRKIQALTGCSNSKQLEAMRNIYSVTKKALSTYYKPITEDKDNG